MFRIKVNSDYIDLYDNSQTILNETFLFIDTPDKRGVPFSNNFYIPKTANNSNLLNIYNSDIQDCELYWKTSLLLNGNISIISIGDMIKVQVVSKANDFFENIDIPLWELNLNEDFYFNRANYSTMNATMANYLTWAFYDTRGYFLGGTWDLILAASAFSPVLTWSRHSLVAKNILTKIIESQGFIADLTVLSSDTTLDELIIPTNAKDYLITDFQYARTTPLAITSGNYIQMSDLSNEITTQVNFVTILTEEVEVITASSKFAIEIELNSSAYLLIDKRTDASGAFALSEKYYIDTSKKIVLSKYEVGDRLAFRFDRDVTISEFRIISLTSEQDFSELGSGYTLPNGDVIHAIWAKNSSNQDPLVDDYYIKGDYNVPNWTQKQFIQELFKLYNFKLVFDAGTIRAEMIDLNEVLDLSDKIATRGVETPSKLGRENIFSYSNDTDVDPNYGNHTLTTDNDLTNKKLVTSKTSASVDVYNSDLAASEITFANIPIYNNTSLSTQLGNVNKEPREVFNHRFLLVTPNNVITNITNKAYFQSESSDNLTFANLYDKHYSQFYDYIFDSKIIIYKMKLTYFDWIDIKNNGVFYDKSIGRELIILQINKFNPNGLTEIKAITREVI